MVVQHNLTAMNANRQLGITGNQQAKSSEKLSSGYKINRASDDAAGLTISEKMRNQIRGLNQASDNAQDGISMIQTAEGALNESHSILQRMSELAVKAANDTQQTIDRVAIQKEINQLATELNRIASTTQFNKMNILDGNLSGAKLMVGANSNQFISVSVGNMASNCIGNGSSVTFSGTTITTDFDGKTLVQSGNSIGSGVSSLNLLSYAAANASLDRIQSAINAVSSMRSTLGAIQNRLEHTIANLDTASENTQAAESRIRDVDMATEMVEYSKSNILAQAGQSMLAQANQSTQGVLSILG